jgi:Enoyl-CoA hydratase/carnithine racemase
MSYIKSTLHDSIYAIVIDKPESLNALDTQVIKELSDEIDKVYNNNQIKVVILTGAGKVFVAGANISEMSTLSPEEGYKFGMTGASLFRKIERLPIPVIAAVNGFALGGGCELALACDIRIASDKAKFGQPEVSLGITPGFSATVRLPKIVGVGMAKELIFSGKIIDAAEALRIGLVNSVTTSEELMNSAMELAKMIASRASGAVQKSKASINDSADMSTDEAIENECKLFSECFTTHEQIEGMKAFLEKRRPNF